MTNNAESVVSNQQDMNSTAVDEVTNLDNAQENVQQVSSQSTGDSAENNLTPTFTPAVIAQKKLPQVYNCKPAAKSSPGKPVLGSKIQQPYKCPFCPKTYSTRH